MVLPVDGPERLRESLLPFAALLGMEFTGSSNERVTTEMALREDLCTLPAILHGGAITAFADTLGAATTVLNIAR